MSKAGPNDWDAPQKSEGGSNNDRKYPGKDKWRAVWIAALLGIFGTHRFYLGEWKWGLGYAVFFWTGIPVFLGLIDAIRYATVLRHEFGGPNGGTDGKAGPSSEPENDAGTTVQSVPDDRPSEVKDFESDMHADEEILEYATGYIGEMMGDGDDKQINGQIILTDERIAFRGSCFLTTKSEDVPLGQIKTVSTEKGLMFGTIEVNGTDFNTTEKHEEMVTELQRARREAQSSSNGGPPQVAQGGNEMEDVERLERLHELKEKGALTEEEFEQQKEDLLEN